MSTYTVCPYCGDRMAIGTMRVHLLDCKGQSPPRNGLDYYAQLNRKTKSTSRDATRVLEAASATSSSDAPELMFSPPPRNPATKLGVESHNSSVPSSSGETSAPNAQLTQPHNSVEAAANKGGTFYRVGVATPIDLTRTSPAQEVSASSTREASGVSHPKSSVEKHNKLDGVRSISSHKSASSRGDERPSSSSYRPTTNSDKPPSIDTRTSSKRTALTQPSTVSSTGHEGKNSETSGRGPSASAAHAGGTESRPSQNTNKSRLSQAMRGSSSAAQDQRDASALPPDSYPSYSMPVTNSDATGEAGGNAELRERIEKLEIACGVVQDVVEQQSEQAAFNLQAGERLFAEVQSQCETCQQLHSIAAASRKDLDERVTRMETYIHKEIQQLRQQCESMDRELKRLQSAAASQPQLPTATAAPRPQGNIQVLSQASYADRYNPNFYADQIHQQKAPQAAASAPVAPPVSMSDNTSSSVKISGLNTSTMYEGTPQLSYLNHNTSTGANSSASGILNSSVPVPPSSSIQNVRVTAMSNTSPWTELLARRQEAKRQQNATMMSHTPNVSRLDTTQPLSIDTIFSKLNGPPSVKAHSPWSIGK